MDVHVDVCDVDVVVFVVVVVQVVNLRTQCESLLVRHIMFRGFQPWTSVEVKTRPIFKNISKIKNNSPKLFDEESGGSQKPQLYIEKDQIHRNTLYFSLTEGNPASTKGYYARRVAILPFG